MTDGSTLIVDVETLGENSYALSLPAEDLWVAYEVVRRHIDANGVRHYSQMIEAAMTDDGYSFKFDTGDVFTCASHLGKPTSSTLSDTPAGGSGGGALVVNVTDGDGGTFVADKSMSEVLSAIASDNPVLCNYNALISFFTKDEDYPEVYANLSTIEQGLDGLFVRMYYFEYAEDGTFSGSKSEAIISI